MVQTSSACMDLCEGWKSQEDGLIFLYLELESRLNKLMLDRNSLAVVVKTRKDLHSAVRTNWRFIDLLSFSKKHTLNEPLCSNDTKGFSHISFMAKVQCVSRTKCNGRGIHTRKFDPIAGGLGWTATWFSKSYLLHSDKRKSNSTP